MATDREKTENNRVNTETNRVNISDLAEVAQELTKKVEVINTGTGKAMVTLAKNAKTNRRLIGALAVSLALDLVLTIVMGFVLTATNHNTDRIGTVTDRLDTAQTVGRQRALCPLYQVFLDSKHPSRRAVYPRGPEAYDKIFETIADGYKALECDSFKGPPPSLGN